MLTDRIVLVVEDEPLLAYELVEGLEGAGAAVAGPVHSVAAALDFLQKGNPIDAAIINVHLRGELSFPIADALKQHSIPFLFVTGNDAFVREHYPDVPAHPKPSDMAQLVLALDELLILWNQQRQPGAQMNGVRPQSDG